MKILEWLLFTFISWGISMSIFKIVTLCCELNFSLLAASGIWLLLGYLKWFFSIGKKENTE